MTLTKKYAFLLIYLFVPLPFLGFYLGGLWTFLPFYIIFSSIPFIDYWFIDPTNPNSEQESMLLRDPFFKWVTLIYIPIQLISLIYALYLVSTTSLSILEWIGFCLSVGLVTGGVGINLSHEFMHKNSVTLQMASKLLLSMVCYGHFIIEHVRGHHVWVATPRDPASARMNESFYHFLPRSIIGSFLSAKKLESNRLRQKKISVYSFQNAFWWIIGAPLLISLLCYMLGGLTALLFFLGQSFMAITVLELVNYIEHYGLERKKLPNGQYEKVSPYHSWNANHWLSNMVLFHLQRHSDHHTHGGRPYQILRHLPQSPQLPSGYLGMMIIALCPPLWRTLMNNRVEKYQNMRRESSS